jgi:hypothetical protein
MASRKPLRSTLTSTQREAAAATLRELAKAAHATAGDSWIHVNLVGHLAALLARLASRLPADWGPYASSRLAEQLRVSTDPVGALTALLYVQTLLAGALDMPAAGDLGSAAAEAYRASQSLLAALFAPSLADRERVLADADSHLAAAHTRLATLRRMQQPPGEARSSGRIVPT